MPELVLKRQPKIFFLLETYLLLIISLLLRQQSCAYSSTDPTWLVSPYFRANNEKVINTMTGNTSTPMYTFTFSSALSGIPNLAYGIKNYRGDDTLINQKFEIRRESLTASTFKVSIQITGYTNIYLLNVAYIAIDPGFPHHLNSFDNVPINKSNGDLVNISNRAIATTTYTNTINYNTQAAGNNYTSFQTPLSSNKMVIFISSLFILSNNQPVRMGIEYTVLNTSHYKWKVTLFQNISIERMHFSQVVYNQNDVMASGVYAIVYEEWTIDSNGGYKDFPHELKDNMIMGLTDFDSIDARCGLEYNWYFVTNQGGYSEAIRLNASNPSNYACGLDRARSILFYIKTWECSAPYIYYNLTSDDCQDGCADYYYANATAATCDACHYACINCTTGSNQLACTQCEAAVFRVLVNNSCECQSGYFDDGYSKTCRTCSSSVSNCATCGYPLNSSLSESAYETIFASGTWPADISADFTCYTCFSPYFLNSTSGQCQACSLNYCLTCNSLTNCSVCNSSASATLYSGDSLCYLCTINNCNECNATNECYSCSTTDSYNLINGSCYLCNQSCTCDGYVTPQLANGSCSTLCGDGYMVGAEQCDDNNTIDHDGCSSACTIQTCAQNCSCDGWVMPYNAILGQCSSVCGDGYLRGQEQCDDNNTVAHDGCSSLCLIQTCQQNCSCDGWIAPFNTSLNQCSTLCGDGYLRGQQQCDPADANSSISIQGQSCNNVTCLYIPLTSQDSDFFFTEEHADITALIVWLMGFRVIGLEMTNVFQQFNLVLQSQQSRQISNSTSINRILSEYVHGYNQEQYYPFQIQQNQENHFLNRFNLTYLLILILFCVSILLKTIGVCFNRSSNQIGNAVDNNSNEENSSQSSSEQSDKNNNKHNEDSSENTSESADFAVHLSGKSKSKNNFEQTRINMLDSKLSDSPLKGDFPANTPQHISKVSKLGNILINQIFFDLIINQMNIFVFATASELLNYSVSSFLNFSSLIVIGSMLLFAVGMLSFLSFQSVLFGQNQLKFFYGKWMFYWLLVVGQRVVMSIIISLNLDMGLYFIVALKTLIIGIFISTNLYFEKIQKIRSISVQSLHLLLLVAFILNRQNLFQSFQEDLPQYFIQIVYLSLLGTIILITIGFYFREIYFGCSADFRTHNQGTDNVQSGRITQNSETSAVFDVKSEQFSSFDDENIKDTIKPIFNDVLISQINQNQNQRSYAKARSIKTITSKNIGFNPSYNINNNNAVESQNHKKTYMKHKRNNGRVDTLQTNNTKFDENNTKVSNIFDQDSEKYNPSIKSIKQSRYDESRLKNPSQYTKSRNIIPDEDNKVSKKNYLKSQRRVGHKNRTFEDRQEDDDLGMNQTKENIPNGHQEKNTYKKPIKSLHYIKNKARKPIKNNTILNNKSRINIVDNRKQTNEDQDDQDNYDAVSINFN